MGGKGGGKGGTFLWLLFGQLLSLLITASSIINDFTGLKAYSFRSVICYTILLLIILPTYAYWDKRRSMKVVKVEEDLENVDDEIKKDTDEIKKDKDDTDDSNYSDDTDDTDESASFRVFGFSFSPLLTMFIASLIDFEANYLAVMSFSYANIINLELSNCLTLPGVVLLSYLFLGSRFNVWQYLSVVICLVGITIHLIQLSNSDEGTSMIGVAIGISGALLYAVSNVMQEAIVKRKGSLYYLLWLSIFGSFIGLVQTLILELSILQSFIVEMQQTKESVAKIVLLLVGYGCVLALFYCLVPVMLNNGGASFFNISLLTSYFYLAAADLLITSVTIEPFYIVSFVLIMVGLLLFNIQEILPSLIKLIKK